MFPGHWLAWCPGTRNDCRNSKIGRDALDLDVRLVTDPKRSQTMAFVNVRVALERRESNCEDTKQRKVECFDGIKNI